MNKKLFLVLGALLISGSVYAEGDYYVYVVNPGYDYSGPNYSGYYNYAPGAAYDYVGPNYSGYYNYAMPDTFSVLTLQEVAVPVTGDPTVIGVVVEPANFVLDKVDNDCVVN